MDLGGGVASGGYLFESHLTEVEKVVCMLQKGGSKVGFGEGGWPSERERLTCNNTRGKPGTTPHDHDSKERVGSG